MQICFLSAQILVEHLNQKDRAKEILGVLLDQYPQHHLYTQMKEYRNQIV